MPVSENFGAAKGQNKTEMPFFFNTPLLIFRFNLLLIRLSNLAIFRGRGAAESEELIEYQQWSLTGEMMVLIQSIYPVFSGRYPHWYFQNGRDS